MSGKHNGYRSMRKRKTTRRLLEHAEQAALIKWAWLYRRVYPELDLLYAVPNGGRRDAVTGAILKAEGVRAGVPDLCLAWPSGKWHGLYIELKAEGGRPTRSQLDWIERLNSAGYLAKVCKGWIEARDTIVAYLEAGKKRPRRCTGAKTGRQS